MATYRLQRLTLNAVNELLDPPGRAFIELESTDGGDPIQLSMPYDTAAIPEPAVICVFIKAQIDPDIYLDDTCGEP